MNLRKMNSKQLDSLIAKAQAQRDNLKKGELTELRRKVNELIRGSGYSASDVLGAGAAKRGRPAKKAAAAKPARGKRGRKAAPAKAAAKGKRGVRKGFKVKPKYRNPADAKQTWAGRGMQPRWYRDAIAAGKKEKDLLIA